MEVIRLRRQLRATSTSKVWLEFFVTLESSLERKTEESLPHTYAFGVRNRPSVFWKAQPEPLDLNTLLVGLRPCSLAVASLCLCLCLPILHLLIHIRELHQLLEPQHDSR